MKKSRFSPAQISSIKSEFLLTGFSSNWNFQGESEAKTNLMIMKSFRKYLVIMVRLPELRGQAFRILN
jgi:hypothetical protein